MPKSKSINTAIKLTIVSTVVGALLTIFYVNRKFGSGDRFVPVISNALPKTVTIYVTRVVKDGKGDPVKQSVLGSGVFVSDNGRILSCAHLVTGEIVRITVELDSGIIFPGRLLTVSANRDLSLLKIDLTNTPYVTLAERLKVGQEVVVIGAPLGLENSVSNGIISALNRDFVQYNSLQTNAVINQGNSGGPLLTMEGELAGIASYFIPVVPYIALNTGLGFAVEVSQIREFLSACKKAGI